VSRLSYFAAFCLLLGGCSEVSSDSRVCEFDVQHYEDEGTLVLNTREIDYLMRGDIIDAPVSLATKSNGARVWILPTALQQNGKIYLSHTVVEGDLANISDAKITVVDEEQMFIDSKNLELKTNGFQWVTNIVQVPSGLLALVHSEYTGEDGFFGMDCSIIDELERCAPGYSQIGLAWLPNDKFEADNYEFTFLGNIAGSYTKLPHFNVHGTPWYYTQDENGEKYLNLLFADAHYIQLEDGNWMPHETGGQRIGRLRYDFDKLMVDIEAGRIGDWQKLTAEGWKEPDALPSLPIIPKVPEMEEVDPRIAAGDVIVHSDAIFHEPSNSYFLSTYTLGGKKSRYGSKFAFYNSCDGESWEYIDTYHTRKEGKSGWSYLTLVASDDTDHGVSRGDFDLITGWEYGKPDRKVLRMKTSVGDGCSCPQKKNRPSNMSLYEP